MDQTLIRFACLTSWHRVDSFREWHTDSSRGLNAMNGTFMVRVDELGFLVRHIREPALKAVLEQARLLRAAGGSLTVSPYS